MNKKVIYLVAMAVLLCGLIALYFYGKNKNSATEDTETAESNSQGIVVVTDIKNPNEIDINNSQSYTVYTNDDEYYVKGYEKNSFSQNSIKYLFSAFSNLRSPQIVEENAADLTKYGLDAPSASVLVKSEEGSTTINIGDITPDGKYAYVSTSLDNNIYMIQKNYRELAMEDMIYLIEQNVTSIAAENVNYVDIQEKGKAEILVEQDNDNENLKNYVSTSGLSALVMKSPIKDAIVYPTNMQDSILCDLSSMAINSVAELNPTDLSKYGLNDPVKTINIKDSADSLTIKIGSDFDDKSVYAMINDKPEVYTLTKASLAAFDNINIMDFVQNFVSLYARSSVNSISINIDNSVHTVELKTEGENKIAVDSEGVKRDNRNTYVDGKLIDKSDFGDFYEAVVGIGFDSVVYENPQNESAAPSAVIEFNLVDGNKDIINYYSYNDNFYYVKDESTSALMLVSKQQLSQLAKYIDDITK